MDLDANRLTEYRDQRDFPCCAQMSGSGSKLHFRVVIEEEEGKSGYEGELANKKGLVTVDCPKIRRCRERRKKKREREGLNEEGARVKRNGRKQK